ncbi:hypothetical protein D3C72_2561980 [compost metagenome]
MILSTVVEAGVTSIFIGFFNKELTRDMISGGIVAEKNNVCRLAGSLAIIRFIS